MNTIQAFKANKTAVAASVAVLLSAFLMTGTVSAAFSAVNENTGFSSLNTVEAEGEDMFTLVNTNLGGVNNIQGVVTQTGLDSSDSNTGDGSTDSGNIDVLGGFSNEFNLNTSSYENGWWEQLVASGNDTTGAMSTNDAEAEFENEVVVTQVNGATLNNLIGVDAVTGENTANTNTGTGNVKTGDGDVSTVQENTANGNSFTSSGSIPSSMFANMAKNITTGFSSTNTTESEVDNEMTVVNTNGALFGNVSGTNLNTGSNASDSNTGNGGVDTGNAKGQSSIANDANANAVTVEIIGASTNSLLAINDTTGASSTNDTETEVESEIDVISNNTALLNSIAAMDVNTGDNTSSTNTGTGDVKTGNGEGRIMIDNGSSGPTSFLNKNTTSLKFTASMFDLMGGNKTTGFSSNNDAESELESEVAIVNTNDANVINTAGMAIETGLNTSDSNTGDGGVDTGNAKAAVSIVNDLNVNNTTVHQMAVGAMAALNDTTGASSTNDVEVEMENELTIVNTNAATVNNTSSITSSTGSNSSSFNTGSGSSTTGNSSVLFGFINQGNGNFNIVQ